MFDDVRAAMFAVLDHPLAVAALILLAGIHAAVWCLVFDRLGYPPVLAALLFIPPLTFFMPVVLVLARWPAPETARSTKRFRRASTPQVRRFAHRARPTGALPPQSYGGRPSMAPAFVRLHDDVVLRDKVALDHRSLRAVWVSH